MESTIRRLLAKIGADRFDAAIGAFVQRLSAGVAPAGRRRMLAVEGKTLRGSRQVDGDGVKVAGRHLLAVIDQNTQIALGQTAVDGKTSEINRFAPLIDTLTGIDLAGVVITAEALHTQREHVADLHARGAHWVLTGQGQPAPAAAASSPNSRGGSSRPAHGSIETGHGCREIRVLKMVTIAAGRTGRGPTGHGTGRAGTGMVVLLRQGPADDVIDGIGQRGVVRAWLVVASSRCGRTSPRGGIICEIGRPPGETVEDGAMV